jgi:hypothetical protein
MQTPLLLGLLFFCSACELIGHEPLIPAIATDLASYTLTPENQRVTVEIEWSYTNTTSKTTFLARCGDQVIPALDWLKDTGWVVTYAPICPETIAIPAKVRPGQSYSKVSRFPLSTPVPAGTYRLRLPLYAAWYPPESQSFPTEQRISNTFEFKIAR